MAARIGVNRRELVSTAQLMEAHIEDPLSFDQIAESVGCRSGNCSACSGIPEHLAHPLLPWFRAALRARAAAAADGHVGDERHGGLRLPVTLSFQQAYRSQFGHPPNSERRRARPDAARAGVGPTRSRRQQRAVRIDHEFSWRAGIEPAYPWAHRPGNQRHAHHVGDPQAVPEDGLHQGPVVLRHRRLTGVEAMGLGPAQSGSAPTGRRAARPDRRRRDRR